MKTFYKITLVFLVVISSSCTSFSKPPAGYTIKVKVKGVKSNATCYLGFYLGDKQYMKDTAKADSEGNFTFEGKEPLPGGIYMVVLPGDMTFDIMVSGTENNFSLETDTSDLVGFMKVQNSEENTIFYDYQIFMDAKFYDLDSLNFFLSKATNKSDSDVLQQKIAAITTEITDNRNNIIKNHPKLFLTAILKASLPVILPKDMQSKPDSVKLLYNKNHFFDNIDLTDDRLARTPSPVFEAKIDEFIHKAVMQVPDSVNKEADALIVKTKGSKENFRFIVWYITTSYENSKMMGTDAVFVHMVENYYMTKKAYWVDATTLNKMTQKALILKPLLIGKPAPEILLQDTTGTDHALKDVKAKYTLVYFWDPHCDHCQKETPLLYKVYEKYYNKGLEVYAVNLGHDMEAWKNYIKDHQLHWTNVYDAYNLKDLIKLYDISATPVIYLLDDKKRIIAKKLNYQQIDNILANEFNSKAGKSKP